MYVFKPRDAVIKILYHDESLVVVDKPAGLLSVPGKGRDKQDCAEARIKAVYPDALTVHRLDMETSGTLIFARNKRIHRELGKQFQNREVEKRYIAVVHGYITEATGKIDKPVICDWPNRPRQKIDLENGKPSTTLYKVLWRDTENQTTRVELVPVTGRTHQLRVHLQSIGHPIIGDRLYGPNNEILQRLMLHSLSLSITHPKTGEPMRFFSELPF